MSLLVDRMSGHEKTPRCGNSRGTTEGKFRMTNDTNTRDALAEPLIDVIGAAVDSDTTVCTRVWEAWSYGTMGPDDFTPLAEDPDSLRNIAEAVLAAGYRKPRTVTEVAELDALPAGATILDARNVVWVNDGDDYEQWASLAEQNKEGGPIWVSSVEVPFPATVLHEPEASL